MVDKLKEWIVKIVTSRLFVVWVVILCLFTFVLQHLFTLQIIKGSDYLDNYMMKIEKTIDIEGTRGNIYDRNGVLLAHNELSYTVTLEDNGTYANNKERAKLLNAEISTLIDMIEKNGDSIVNDLICIWIRTENCHFYLREQNWPDFAGIFTAERKWLI